MNTMLRLQRGQMLLLMVFLVTGLLGMAGIAIDLGFGYQHRREVQNAADAAAVAGALALGRYIEYNRMSATQQALLYPNGDPWGTGTVLTQDATNAAVMAMPPFPAPNTATGQLATNLNWPPAGGIGSLTVQYVMVDGTTVAVGTGTPPATAAGVRVIANASYKTLFARIFGFESLPVEGTSRAMLRVAGAPPTGAPFIVCGGTAAGDGAWLAPDRSPNPPDPYGVTNSDPTYKNGGYYPGMPLNPLPSPQPNPGIVSMWVSGSSPKVLDYGTWVGRNFMVHWGQLGSQPGTGCGINSTSMNGLADPNAVCTPSGASPFPCTEPYRTGTVAGTTTQTVAGIPGCSGTSWNNCAMLLPISDGCDSYTGSCNVVTYAPFLIMDGTLPINGAYSPQNGCNSNCHIGQLLPAAMAPAIKAGTGVFNPQTSNGLFTVQLSCDPIGGSCGL